MGEPREREETHNSELERICWRRSGEALRRNQLDGEGETAT